MALEFTISFSIFPLTVSFPEYQFNRNKIARLATMNRQVTFPELALQSYLVQSLKMRVSEWSRFVKETNTPL